MRAIVEHRSGAEARQEVTETALRDGPAIACSSRAPRRAGRAGPPGKATTASASVAESETPTRVTRI